MTNKSQLITVAIYFLSLVAILSTISLLIYSAHPWGGNYAYKTASDYLLLLVFIFWAFSPYMYLLIRSFRARWVNKQLITWFVVSMIVCAGGVSIFVDTVFIHIDAQGALVFLFLPIYQWVILVIFKVVDSIVWRKKAH